MTNVADASTWLAASVALMVAVLVGLRTQSGAEAAPAEGLTPFGFLMARAYGEPAEHPVMRFIAFKPDDGAKFRQSFEKKHGPRGRDLIDSLGRGSYKSTTDTATAVVAGTDSSDASLHVKSPSSELLRGKRR